MLQTQKELWNLCTS